MQGDNEIQDLRKRSFPLLVGVTGLALGLSAVPAMHKSSATERDQARVAALFDVDRALRAYESLHGEPPSHVPDKTAGGWETTLNGCFLDVLVRDGLLYERRLDPVNDEHLHFRYHRYEPESYGTVEPFYVLALTGFEDEATADHLLGIRRSTRVGDRDWSLEYPLVLTSR